jgi:hypothetical protein
VAHRECRDQLAHKDHKGRREIKDQAGQADRRVYQVLRVFREIKAPVDLREFWVIRDLKDHKEIKDQVDHKAFKVTPEQQDHKAPYRVH